MHKMYTYSLEFSKYDLLAAFAEFAGTFYFLFMGSGGAVSIGPNTVGVIGVPFAFGFSLLMNVWIWAPVSDGVLNPAITIALMSTGNLPLIRGILYIISQFAGAALGSYFVSLFQPGPPGGATVLAAGVTAAQGFFLELFATSLLTMAVYMLAVRGHASFTAPIGIGLSLFISAIAIGPYTGASLNPARTFGTAVVTGEYGESHWVYYIGTTLGSLLAAAYMVLLDKCNYPKCTKTNDVSDEKTDSPKTKRDIDVESGGGN